MRWLRISALPFIILLVGTLMALASSWQLGNTIRERSRARFDALVDSSVTAVRAKMDAQAALLRGGAGLFAANQVIGPSIFYAYAEQLDFGKNYPGVLGLGYSAYLPTPAERESAIDWMRRSGGEPDFRIWPEGTRQDYSAIAYLYPRNGANRIAIGFDMLSEPHRREAAMRAARTGEISVTAKVLLVQEKALATKQPGILLYVPVYWRANHKLRGWAYSPLRTGDLFGAVFDRFHRREVTIAIYDGAVSPDNLLYRSDQDPPLSAHSKTVPFTVGGRQWNVVVRSTPLFETESPLTLPLLLGLGGIITSALLAAIAAIQARAMRQTRIKVRQRTAELQQANDRLHAESRSREAAEAQIRQMQKMDAVGQLTGGIAHDFNNMLAIIIGSLDLARLRIDEPRRVLRLIDQAMEGAQRATALTQRLLAFARRQSLDPQPTDPDRLIENILDLLARSLGETIRLETELDPATWTMFVDPGQLEQAILNLSINARDAMPDGGTLTIRTENVTLDDAYCARQPDAVPGSFVRISVCDTGAGMTPEVLDKAIEPFFSTKPHGKGTGLGLSQVFGFVRQSGGHITLESHPGKGTTVAINLPRHVGPVADGAPGAATTEKVAAGHPQEHILVVEDERLVRSMSVNALRDLGYTVHYADSGANALELLGRLDRIDLLFTDVVMPDMNGVQLAEKARALRPDLTVLFTSGYAPAHLIETGLAETGGELLPKPFSVEQLAAKVRACLDAVEPVA